MSNTSRSRAEIDTLMDKLFTVRNIEKTLPHKIKHEFGKLSDVLHAAPPRIVWIYQGGKALEKVPAPDVVGDQPEKTVPAVGYRRSDYLARIWAPDLERAEIILDQLVTASRLTDYPDKYVFENMNYTVPTELEGKWLELGSVIDAQIGIRSSVPAVPVGTDIDVIVAGNEFRAGYEIPSGEDLEDSVYDVDRLTGPWPG